MDTLSKLGLSATSRNVCPLSNFGAFPRLGIFVTWHLWVCYAFIQFIHSRFEEVIRIFKAMCGFGAGQPEYATSSFISTSLVLCTTSWSAVT